MLNFNFSENGLGPVSPKHLMHEFSRKICYILLNDQMPLSGWLYFVRYWVIYGTKYSRED